MGTERDIGDALLRENGRVAGTTGVSLADEVERRERRRVYWWAIATAVLWVLTALYFLALLWAYLVLVHPVINEFLTNEEFRQQDLRVHASTLGSGLKALSFWPILLFVAAACTMIFILTSRRATLRQVRSGLAEISEQLRALATHGPDEAKK